MRKGTLPLFGNPSSSLPREPKNWGKQTLTSLWGCLLTPKGIPRLGEGDPPRLFGYPLLTLKESPGMVEGVPPSSLRAPSLLSPANLPPH